MVNIGLVLLLGGVITSIGIALYAYEAFQPNYKIVNAGEAVEVGPVEYIVTYEGQFEGSEEVSPEHSFLKIRIVAKNLEQEPTQLSGIQFQLVDNGGNRSIPIHGAFSDEDLLYHTIEYNKAVSYTTQFDVPFSENSTYNVRVEPRKEHNSLDIGMVCIFNC